MKGPLKIEGLFVEVRGSFEKSFRAFNKKVQDSGKLREYREREYYEKPSDVKTRAKQLAKKREQRRRKDERDLRGSINE